MTKEELLQKLSEIEWDDFECKAAKDKLPEDVWSTVSAFSNTSGGWIVFGIRQVGKKFEIQGVNNGEKTESDFLNTLRGGQKFNMRLSAKGTKYNFDGKLVLAFFVPSSFEGQDNGTAGEQAMEQAMEQVQRLVNVIREDSCTISTILKRLHLKGRSNVVMNYLKPAIEGGYVLRSYPDKPSHPKQRYYLSEKGLKLVNK